MDGQQLLQQGRPEEAVKRFNQQKQADPSDPLPYFLAGMTYSQMQDYKAAAAELKEALRLNPGNLEFRITY